MEAHRELFLEIDYGWIIYILAVLSIAALAYAVYHRVQLWKMGQKDDSFSNMGQKTKAFLYTGLIDGIIHKRIIRDFYPGIPHALIFWGALFLLFGTAMDVVSHYIVDFLHGNTYLAISCLSDIGGAIFLIGLIVLVIRRYVQRPDRLDNNLDDAITIAVVFIIVLTGFILEGLRMVVSQEHFPALPIMTDWAPWSFLGYAFAKAFEDGSHLTGWYQGLWWFHSLLIIGTIFYMAFAIPKLTHIAASPLNVFFRPDSPKGALRTIELEEAETFGAGKINDLTFKDLLELDACTRCGRCQDNCPAYLSGKPLSPKKIIQDLKALMNEQDPGLLHRIVATEDSNEKIREIVGEVITEDELWACTTCRSCQEQCPAFIEPINKIIEMRRYQVLEQAQFPEAAMGALKSIEQRGHPWRGTTASRTDWTEDLDIKLISDDSDIEVLYWVGCTAALEDRNIKVARAVGKVLKAAGVNFAILGDEETCCGEPARRIGNEYLFQMLVQQNIETLNGYGVKKIVTACPHCFNTIKNEYPQFGGNFEVYHHTEFIAELIKQGKLKVSAELGKRVTYHDSCYLGRYNDIFQAPREILLKANGKKGLLEMDRHMNKSFCCGAGGGRMWMEEDIGTRISEMRAQEAVDVNAEVIASACPFCMQMFEDAIKALGKEEELKALDIAEILADAIDQQT